ncbi:hypothetical protein E3N88_13933 [Mikania micrantha]|uniref:Uncharacterized protein n=1 Tax=Mikania micrantha TaxID=192012 RepID=A0A5N6P221_9ASTR|nr:hypothetical protein E3N88_13933 [Mikania micrantha]
MVHIDRQDDTVDQRPSENNPSPSDSSPHMLMASPSPKWISLIQQEQAMDTRSSTDVKKILEAMENDKKEMSQKMEAMQAQIRRYSGSKAFREQPKSIRQQPTYVDGKPKSEVDQFDPTGAELEGELGRLNQILEGVAVTRIWVSFFAQ